MDFNPALAALEIQPVEPVDLFPATQVDEDFAGPTAEHPSRSAYPTSEVPMTCGPSNSCYVGSTVVDGLVYSTFPFDTQVFDDVTPTNVDGMANFACVGEVTAGVAAMADPNTQAYQEGHTVYNDFACLGEVAADVAAMAYPNTQAYQDGHMVYYDFACVGEVTAGVAAMADPNTHAYQEGHMVYKDCVGEVTAGVAAMADPNTQAYDDTLCDGWMGIDMAYPDGVALGPAPACCMGIMGNDFVPGNTWSAAERSAATAPSEPFCGNHEYFPAPCSTSTTLQHNVPATCAGPMMPLWEYIPHGDSQFIPDDDLLNCFQEAAARPCGLAGGSPEVIELESGDEAVQPAVPAMTINDEHKAAEDKSPKVCFPEWGWVFFFQTKVERRWCAHIFISIYLSIYPSIYLSIYLSIYSISI